MDNFKILYVKPKSLLRELIQKLFLKLLLKLFPNKFLTYKNKIRSIMNKSGYYISLGLVIIYLRFKYPHYISLPSRHIYALHILIKFLEVLKRQKINFFLIAGTLLGAVRQESFAGRPKDIDLGIIEEQFPILLKAIPLLKKNGVKVIRRFPNEEPTRLQIFYPNILVDVGIYKKKKIGKGEVWLGNTDRSKGTTFSITDLKRLIPVKLYGKVFFSPSNPEIYLEKSYGKSWKTPNIKQFFWNKNKFK